MIGQTKNKRKPQTFVSNTWPHDNNNAKPDQLI